MTEHHVSGLRLRIKFCEAYKMPLLGHSLKNKGKTSKSLAQALTVYKTAQEILMFPVIKTTVPPPLSPERVKTLAEGHTLPPGTISRA